MSEPLPNVVAHTSEVAALRSSEGGLSSVSACNEYDVTCDVYTSMHSVATPPWLVSKSKKAIRNFLSTYGVSVACSTKVNLRCISALSRPEPGLGAARLIPAYC